MKRRVVVTGLGTINPLGNSVAATWDAIMAMRSGIAPITAFDASDLKTRFAGEIKEFDPMDHFGRKDARQIERVSQLALVAADQAIRDAGVTVDADNRHRVGVVLGSGIGGIGATIENHERLMTRGPSRINPFFIPQMLPDTAPGLIAIHYGYRGPNMSIATACASGNNAIGEAARMVGYGSADIVLTGGCEAAIYHLVLAGFSIMGALSTRNDAPHAAARPFDADRDGFVASEGAAILVLEELEHAQARGAHIYAEVLGYGTSADAYHISAPHEQGEGAILAMRAALADAGLEPSAIGYVNAHGTSTPLNDRMETLALKQVLGERAYEVPVSSTKSLHGHLLGATSALEALISVTAMGHGIVPATANYATPDPECDLDYVTAGPRPLPFETFMSNGFGFGGHNATIIMGKYK